MQYRKKIISFKIINSLLYIFYNKLRTMFRMKFSEKCVQCFYILEIIVKEKICFFICFHFSLCSFVKINISNL